MNIWEENKLKPITIVESEDAVITLSYKSLSNNTLINIPNPAYLGNNIWETNLSLPKGEYLIFINSNKLQRPTVKQLRVVTAEQYDLTILQNQILSKNSMKIVG